MVGNLKGSLELIRCKFCITQQNHLKYAKSHHPYVGLIKKPQPSTSPSQSKECVDVKDAIEETPMARRLMRLIQYLFTLKVLRSKFLRSN